MIWWTAAARPRGSGASGASGALRVLVVGDVMLDTDVVGMLTRICPDAPAPVLDVTGRHDRPGGAGLAALMLATRDDVTVTLASATREDAVGHRLAALLRRGGVGLESLAASDATRRLTRVRAVTGSSGSGASGAAGAAASLVRVDDPGGHALPATERGVLVRRLVDAADVVLVADYGGGVSGLPGVRAALADAVARGVPVVWDPHPRGSAPVPGVAVATPNRAEVRAALGARHGTATDGPDAATSDLDVAAAALREQWQVGAVAATDGARGVITAGTGLPFFTPTPFAAAGDTCGAGDRFAGALALGLGRGLDLPDAVAEAVADVASWLAGGGVAGLYAAPSSPARRFTTNGGGNRHGSEATALIDRMRAAGGTVVATGGCFDVLHAGHVASLEAARRLGDCLIVLVNSDDSVRRLKGPSRPVNSQADRARVLAGLAAVDAVVVFDEDDPCAALTRLRPDVWAKGGDYADVDLPEKPLLAQWGGRVVLLPYLPGRSTTRILTGAHASPAPEPAPEPAPLSAHATPHAVPLSTAEGAHA